MTILSIKAPFQTSYTIVTNCDNLVHLLNVKYGKYIKEELKNSDISITVIKKADTYSIQYLDNQYNTSYPLQEIDRILFENTHYDETIFALHGAAVEHSGKAYLFLASTTSGKTTLASYLSSNGFGYITDDCILLDRTSFEIHPHHTPIHLRDGGVEVLNKYHSAPQNLIYLNDVSIQRYIYTPENCTTTKLPLGKFFFITRTENKNNIVSMNTQERMTQLMKAPITNYIVTGDYIKFISKLATAECYRLFYSDMEYVSEVIRNGQ